MQSIERDERQQGPPAPTARFDLIQFDPARFDPILSRILALNRLDSTRMMGPVSGRHHERGPQDESTRSLDLDVPSLLGPEVWEGVAIGATEAMLGAVPARVGRYEVQGVLGRGGMGIVLQAYDARLDRKLAIKLLHPHLAHRFSARLVREAQALARLSHPNVVQVYEVGTDEGQAFVAMELVPGVTLRQWQAEPRPWRECVEVYVQAGQGLAAAHAKGLVHRDFKPSNCILDRQGRVRVLDFGLVREVDAASGGSLAGDSFPGARPDARPGAWLDVPFSSGSTTTAGTIVGTLAYMSPEQLRAESADARADQFCFCVALYEALYGERPFSQSAPGLRSMAIEGSPLEVRPEADRVPARLREAVLKGLAYRPEDRWASMEALLGELGDIIGRPEGEPAGWMNRLMVAAAIAIGMGGAGPTVLDGVGSVDGTEDQARRGVVASGEGC